MFYLNFILDVNLLELQSQTVILGVDFIRSDPLSSNSLVLCGSLSCHSPPMFVYIDYIRRVPSSHCSLKAPFCSFTDRTRPHFHPAPS